MVVFNNLSVCLFMNHNGMSHPKKNILNRWSVMQRVIQSSFTLYTVMYCHTMPPCVDSICHHNSEYMLAKLKVTCSFASLSIP